MYIQGISMEQGLYNIYNKLVKNNQINIFNRNWKKKSVLVYNILFIKQED